jgi:hypothetical protein
MYVPRLGAVPGYINMQPRARKGISFSSIFYTLALAGNLQVGVATGVVVSVISGLCGCVGKVEGIADHPVRLSLSARLISRGTVFFSHSKTATAGL